MMVPSRGGLRVLVPSDCPRSEHCVHLHRPPDVRKGLIGGRRRRNTCTHGQSQVSGRDLRWSRLLTSSTHGEDVEYVQRRMTVQVLSPVRLQARVGPRSALDATPPRSLGCTP
jgi:hypothetical protein